MLNVRKKIEHNVVMNVKILIDQVARYSVKRWKSKLRAQSARVLPSTVLCSNDYSGYIILQNLYQLGFLLYNAECIHATLLAFANGGFSKDLNCGPVLKKRHRTNFVLGLSCWRSIPDSSHGLTIRPLKSPFRSFPVFSLRSLLLCLHTSFLFAMHQLENLIRI
jgi:hypothetical protein